MKTQVARCVKCGKARPVLAIQTHNPFCSRECAERAYGTFKQSSRVRLPVAMSRLNGRY